MQQDVVDIAEAKLDSLLSDDSQAGEQADEVLEDVVDNNSDEETTTDHEEPKDEQPEDGEQGQGEDEEEGSPDGEEEAGEEEGDDRKEGEGESEKEEGESKDSKRELSDEELLAELEKRGLKVAKKDEEEKKEQQQPQQSEWEKRPSELSEEVWDQMPAANKFIYSNLPYMTAVGKDGQTYQVKTFEQLPDDFEFANKKAEQRFNSDLVAQSNRAEAMAQDLRNYAKTQQEQEQRVTESQQVVNDVERLQKEGIVPKINADLNSDGFNDDEGVKVANEILKLHQELNAGGERISVYRAGQIYKGMHPELYAPKPTVAKGDVERKRAARRISNNAGSEGSGRKRSAPKRRFPVGMSARDIADFYESDLD